MIRLCTDSPIIELNVHLSKIPFLGVRCEVELLDDFFRGLGHCVRLWLGT